jgi:hypothetical protein
VERIRRTLNEIVGVAGAVAGGFLNTATALNCGYGADGIGRKVTNLFWKNRPAGPLKNVLSYVVGTGAELIGEATMFSEFVYRGISEDASYFYLVGADVLLKTFSIMRSMPNKEKVKVNENIEGRIVNAQIGRSLMGNK